MIRDLTAVLATSRDGCIGRDGDIPWHKPEDFRHFKRTTKGGVVIMGRTTWDALPKRPLPGRVNVVLSRTPGSVSGPDHHRIRRDELDALLARHPNKPRFLIGGAEVLSLLWDRIDRFILTRVAVEVPDGDTWFPEDRLYRDFQLTDTEPLSQDCLMEQWHRKP